MPSFLDQTVEGSLLEHQGSGRIKLNDLTLVKHDHTVRVNDCVDAMCDRNDGPIAETLAEGLLQQRIRFNVYRSLQVLS